MTSIIMNFRTQDKKYGLILDDGMVEKLLGFCKASRIVETGGILVGYYSKKHDWAIVSDISGPPKDSKHRRSSFIRGINGLQHWLNRLWTTADHYYYLGEWHYHPLASPYASQIDIEQLKEHAENGPLNCPEPIMVIVGGDPSGSWEVKAYVYPKGEELLEMETIKSWS